MKKYFVFAAAAIAALASCSKVETDPTAPDQEVSFIVANYMASTKAGTTASAAFNTAEPFGTFAMYTEGSYSNASAATVFMNNQKITFQTPDWKAAGAVYYWPKKGKLSFISYAPYYDVANSGMAAAPTFAYDSQSSKDVFAVTGYTVNKSIEGQVTNAATYDVNDLMYSTFNPNQTANEDKHYGDYSTGKDGVATLFHHMLSKVNVKVGVATVDPNSAYAYGAVVKSVAINGVYVSGDYENDKLDGSIGVWTPAGSVLSTAETLYSDNTTTFRVGDVFTYTGASDKGVYTGVDAKSFVADYYVLPQVFGDETAKLVITYDFYTLDKTTKKVVSVESITETKYTTVNLKDMKKDDVVKNAWVENTVMTYTVTITPGGEIHFDPAQTGWLQDASGADIELGK